MTDVPLRKGLFHMPKSRGDKPYLLGSRCHICGYTCFPRKEVCIVCRRDDTMEEIKLGQRGTLEAFAVMRVGPPTFPPPYMVGYVRTMEGALVFTPITGCETEEKALEIGEEMELVIDEIRKDAQGNRVIGWKYKPVRNHVS